MCIKQWPQVLCTIMSPSIRGLSHITTAGSHDQEATRPWRTATTRRYLMCPPAYFDVRYSINPWMDPTKPVNRELAILQWQQLADLYVKLRHKVELIPALPGLPDMVFATNGGTVLDRCVLVARFLHDQRAPVADAYFEWFHSKRFHVQRGEWVNEGEGDYLAAGPWLLAGSGFRTDPRSHRESEEFFGRPVISLTLVNERYYHLDTALAVLDDDQIMYYPEAFSTRSRAILRKLFPGAILATDADARVLGLNAVSDGWNVILPEAATHLAKELRARDFRPLGIDLSELLKAGGGVKCCTLELRDRATEHPHRSRSPTSPVPLKKGPA